MFCIIEKCFIFDDMTWEVVDHYPTEFEAILKLHRYQRKTENDSNIEYFIKEFDNIDIAEKWCDEEEEKFYTSLVAWCKQNDMHYPERPKFVGETS